MGLLWGRKKKNADAKEDESIKVSEAENPKPTTTPTTAAVKSHGEGSGLGAETTSVFEFGSAGSENITLAGYCPVSDSLEPCRWEILPAGGEAPKFRIIF